MRIDPRLTAAMPLAGPSAGAAAGRPSFRLGDSARSGAPASARASAPLATLDAILMLQGEEDPGERRRRSARRGQGILDALDGLKAALLGGEIDPADLARISDRLASAARPSGDPVLDELVGHIELRARVELAKLGRI